MNRRGFLKMFGLGFIAIAIPKATLAFGEGIQKRWYPRKIKPVGKWKQEKKLTGRTRYLKNKDGEYIRGYEYDLQNNRRERPV